MYYRHMPRRVDFKVATELSIKGILGFMKREVTWYGSGAKVTCPKEFLGKTAYLVITDEKWVPHEGRSGGERKRKA
jgi:putative transposon-encoded protein